MGYLDKATGHIEQRSLATGLNLPHDSSLVIAYKDSVLGLEYLRRANDFHNHGLTLSLRGYQHAVLLHWRELRSTAAFPWDRLCDALHGSGVYSIDEALSQLQIRPLLEALRQAVSSDNIYIFSKLSRGLNEPHRERAAEAFQKSSEAAGVKTPEPSETIRQPKTKPETINVDVRLRDFIKYAYEFKDRVRELSELDGDNSRYGLLKGTSHFDSHAGESRLGVEGTKQKQFELLTAASLRLPLLVSAFPEKLQIAAGAVLPSPDVRTPLAQSWAPVLAWLVFQTLPPHFSPADVFEKLNLRWALSETFSSVGLEGEMAWKTAAQVNVLLKFADDADRGRVMRTERFWRDPDVRWLAGLNSSNGVEYLNLERFEELVSWFEAPQLLDIAVSSPVSLKEVAGITTAAVNLTETLQQSGYEYHQFLDSLRLESPSSSVAKRDVW